jgi:prepilin-type N-terminal cleavage/methylation domain-containing protein
MRFETLVGRMTMKCLRKSSGFTLIEVVIVIVVLGIMATIAIAKYQDLATDAKTSACRAALGGLRGGISTWYSKQVVAGQTVALWPPIDSLRTVNKVIINQIPPNPFQLPDRAPDSIVTGVTRGVIVGTRGGWAYKANTGEIWANTNTAIGTSSGCSGSTTTNLNENTW